MLNQKQKEHLEEYVNLYKNEYRDRLQSDIEERELRRKNHFSNLSSQEKIQSMDFFSFTEIVKNLWASNGWSNKDWYINNTMRVNETNYKSYLDAFSKLLFSQDPIHEKINTFIDNTKGMGLSYISELLYLSPLRLPIYNAKAKKVIDELDLKVNDSLPHGKKNNQGFIYKEFIDLYTEILGYVQSLQPEINTFEKLDSLFWLVGFQDKEFEHAFISSGSSTYVIKMGDKQRHYDQLRKAWEKHSIASFGIETMRGYFPQEAKGYDYSKLKDIMESNGASQGLIKKYSSYVKIFHGAKVEQDWAIAYYKKNIYGFGKITTSYHQKDIYPENWDQAVGVDWTWIKEPIYVPDFSKDLYKECKKNSSVSTILNTKAISDFQKIINKHSSRPEAIEDVVIQGNYSIEDVCKNTFSSEEEIQDLISPFLNNGKKQLLFDGVPGTGKTHLALELAKYLTNMEDKPVGSYKVIPCHGAMTFENLFDGLMPNAEGKLLPKKGLITEMVEKAAENEDANFVVILDEINRSNIPMVFGQMLYLLEKRGESHEVDLPYSNDSIFFPENLFFIGTMNSVDKTSGVLDLAFRRRFVHHYFKPNPHVIKSYLLLRNQKGVEVEMIVKLFDTLNEKLQDYDSHFQVGHSYFITNYPLNDAGLNFLWKTEITPLLLEKFFHEQDVVEREFTLKKLLLELRSLSLEDEVQEAS